MNKGEIEIEIEIKVKAYGDYLYNRDFVKSTKEIGAILDSVNEELSEYNSPPSAYRCYIFMVTDSKRALFNDTFISDESFSLLKKYNIINPVGVTNHQGEECIKYKFVDFEYPKKVLYDHKTHSL